MPGKIESDDPKILRELGIGKQMTPLPCIGARSVQAHQRNGLVVALVVFLEIDPMRLAADVNMDIAANHRFDRAAHHAATAKC